MSTAEETLEKREQELESRIQMLERQLDRLNSRISDENISPNEAPSRPEPVKPRQIAADEPPELSEEVLSWASQNSVLPRLATICFLMVIALGLRTITDSGLVDKLAGSILGMGYAAALMIFGWYKYGKESPLAPVFAACGAVLMSTIVVETHMHFLSLPLVPAYLTLMATGFGMALMSRRFNAFVPISVGVFGMCFAGAAIDYPHPYFPYLSLVLLTANILGYFAAQLKRCSWLRWTVLIVTMVMVQLWGVRLGILLSKGEAVPPELAPVWYLPVLALFFTTFITLALFGIAYAGDRKISRFDFSLPTVSVIWAFLLARHVTVASQLNVKLLGATGLVFAACFFGITAWCARRPVTGAPGTNTFALAGGILVAMALPTATGAFTMTLPIVSILAAVLVNMARSWENGGLRGTAYLLNSYCCIALTIALQGNTPETMTPVNMLPAAILAGVLIYQYQWCRRWPPTEAAKLFGGLDKNDRSALVLLLAGLVCSFLTIRIGLYHALLSLPANVQKDAFRCSQSVLINAAAIGLIMFAFMRRNREIRNVAILVTLAGGIKVFLYDLLGTHGLPLVFSIFSFGLAASIESLALGKWTKEPGRLDATKPE